MALLPSPSSRRDRRSQLRRGNPQWQPFSRCWQRTLSPATAAILLLGLLPTTPAHAVSAAATAYYQVGANGNYSTNGNFHDAPTGGNVVVPDGSNGTFYMVVNTTGGAITHDHSTGPGGVDTISGLNTNGSFYLTGGTLAGNAPGAGFSITGSVFQISGGATLRNFAVTGTALQVNSSSATLDNVTTGINGTVRGTLTFAGNTVATVASGDTLSLGNFQDGPNTLAGTGTLKLTGGTLAVGLYCSGVVGSGITVSGNGAFSGNNSGVTNNGTIQASGGALSVGGFPLTNNGTVQAATGGTLNLNTDTTNLGTINAADGGIVNINNLTLTGTNGTTTGLISSAGIGVVNFTKDNLTNVTTSATASVIGGTTFVRGTLTNTGTITVAADSTLSLGNFQDSPDTLAGTGTVVLAGGTLGIGTYDQGIIASGATVSGNGAVNGNNSNLVNNGALHASGGALNVNVGTSGSGTVSADKGSTLNFNGGSTLNQQGGTSQVDGAITLNGTFTLSSGTLQGTGTLNGNVVNNGGTVKPGDSPGTLTVNGNYSQPSGNLLVEFTNSAHGLLAVTGTASTGGTVQFSFLDTAVNPATVGETFDFLVSTGLSTSLTNPLFTQYFSNETVGGLVTEVGPGGGVFQIAQDPGNANALQVTVISAIPAAAPEPSQYAAFAIGLLGLGALVLKARKRVNAA